MDGNYISFRKAKVGGFNKKDVINYIEKMRNDFYDYKKAVESTVDNLNAKIRELEAITDTDGIKNNEPSDQPLTKADDILNPISDINDAAIKLRMVADELCRNLTSFMACASVENKSASSENCSEKITEEDAEIVPDDFQEQEAHKNNRVAEILGSSANFSFEKSDHNVNECETLKEKELILDKLSSSSFFN